MKKKTNEQKRSFKVVLQKLTASPLALAAIALTIGLVSFGLFYSLGQRSDGATYSQAECDGAICVALGKDGAKPNEISVPLGGFVQFNSADGKKHQMSIGSGGHDHSHQTSFNSPTIGADEGWRVQFNNPGSFYMHDHTNPDINVLIVVYEPGKDYRIKS